MGQASLLGSSNGEVAAALEALTPGDFIGLAAGRLRYTLLLNADGGIVDDLMVTRPAAPAAGGRLDLVVNAARKAVDYADLRARLPAAVRLEVHERGLVALQGPEAAAVMARHGVAVGTLAFMASARATVAGVACTVSRSGYTGEDGFELSVAARDCEALARALLAEPEVKPAGLGARDSLRLEAGLPLYGHDLDETTSPIEAGLAFAVARRRREEGGFPGAGRIRRELAGEVARLRVGLLVEGAPAREGAEVLDQDDVVVGRVTSGGFSPTLKRAVAMAYVPPPLAAAGTALGVRVRGRRQAATVAPTPFVPHRYVRRPAAHQGSVR
jgi:aminomethyltransferase